MRRLLPLLAIGVLFATSVQVRAAEGDFDSNGVKIHYTDEGQGEPLILIHGFTGQGGFWMDPPRFPPGGPPRPPIGKELAKEYRVIAIDCRGHGKSGKPLDPQKYGKEMAADVVRLMDHLKLKKAHVAGYSMGGFITMKLVADHPDRLLSATVGGAGAIADVDDRLRENVAQSLEEGKGIKPLIERLTPKGRPLPSDEQMKAIDQMILANNDPKALAAVMRGMKALTVPEAKLKENQVPAQCIIGELDPLKTGVDAIKDKMTNLRVIVIPDADHMTTSGDPKFLQSIKEFLAKHRQKG
jgi:pimeloyl-ACP methyl ester carboxylesterase